MGLILFNLCIILMFKIIDKYIIISYHSYADDIQLYINYQSFRNTNSIQVLEECINKLIYIGIHIIYIYIYRSEIEIDFL